MKITFARAHLSLISLPATELPDFTVITGKNGAGKSHLLQAMANGGVAIDIAPKFENQIRLFDWNTIVPTHENSFESQSLIKEQEQVFRSFDTQRTRSGKRILSMARNLEFPIEYLGDVSKLVSLSEADLAAIFADEQRARTAFVELSDCIDAASSQTIQNLRSISPAVEAVCCGTGKSLFALRRDEFIENLPPGWGHSNLFQQSFARLFVAYRDLALENRVRRCAIEDGESATPALTREEFRNKYGIPPWEFVNSVLEDAQLPFKVDSPGMYRPEPYTPTLTKTTTGLPVAFHELSSGEKVLMSFALCVYYARDRRQLSEFPSVLLLDEVDAPLHPSMCRSIVNTITETLVRSHNIHVVLATHSPATVAIVPDSAVHVMHADRPGVHKVSKGTALNLLTDGVPTLAVSFDGRRQVFVEGKHDSSVYDSVYQNLKAKLKSERSLSFIPVGNKKKKGEGEGGGGCDAVKRVVRTLSETGNLTVMGLIDWDEKNSSSDRVHVLAEGERYSIESCIYDPLVLAALIARDASKQWGKFELPDCTYTSFQSFEVPELQRLVDAVELLVVGDESTQRASVAYLGGFNLEVSLEYLRMYGHGLEETILDAVPELHRVNSHAGDLMRHVSQKVLKELPRITPLALYSALDDLLNADIVPVSNDPQVDASEQQSSVVGEDAN